MGGGEGGSTIVDSYEISVEQQALSGVLSSLEVTLDTPTVAVTVEVPEISTTLSSLEVEIDE
jgi:hypothetical protein